MSVICPSCGQETPEGFPRCANCGSALEATTSPPREERKVVTCLFCDLVGFTAKAELLDPEDVRRVLQPYHARLRSELERHGGTVEKFIGDAVMAVFGAPVAHEDDPERAVRAALAIREALAEEGELDVRIGITTGEALVALGARPEAGEGMASGDVVNTAARLQTAAPTNGILVDETTYRATTDSIDYERAEPVAAKGKADPVLVWQALDARSLVTVERAHEAALVGREREVSLLRDALSRAREERSAQLVTLVGVPGIGKSRLVLELFRAVEDEPELMSWRHGRCLPYGEGASFWALGEIVKAQAGILDSDTAEAVEAKLRDVAGGDDWVEAHLRPLAGLSPDPDSGGSRVEAFAAWRRFLELVAENGPLILVFEDVHWADDDLLDFVDHLVDWATGVPVLAICTARPELLERRPAWGGGKPNALTLSLSPLSDDDTARLLGDLLDRSVLAADVQADLLARAGGNPLYAEQYARMLRERGDASAVPETVHGIVAARLDLLAPAEKELLQDAAVIGRTFWAGALAAMGGHDRTDVETRLHPLERKHFLRRERRSSIADDTEYTFLHLLVRDVAYGQIPRAERGEKHERAAAWVESLGRPEDHADLLAHHYLTALELAETAGAPPEGLVAQAARAAGEAADRALALNAFAAAARFYEHAVRLTAEDDPDRPWLLLRFSRALHQVGTGDEVVASAVDALVAAKDVGGAAEAELLLADLAWHRADGSGAQRRLERAVSLLESAPPSAAKARVLSETARFHMRAFRDEEAVEIGVEAIAMAEELGLDLVLAHALDNVGVAQALLGDEQGFRNLERSIELAERLNSPEAARGYANLGVVQASLGDLAACIATWQRGAEAARRFGDSTNLRWVSHLAEMGRSFLHGDWEALLKRAEETIAGPRVYFQRSAHEFRGRVRLTRGDLAGTVADAQSALELSAPDPQSTLPSLTFAALVHAAVGRPREAEGFVEQALAYEGIHRPVPHFFAPWFDLGWTLVDLGHPDELLGALGRVGVRTRWVAAGEAIARGDYIGAARLYDEIGNPVAAGYSRLRAAQAGLADAELERAVAFFRKAGATAWLAAAESVTAASA